MIQDLKDLLPWALVAFQAYQAYLNRGKDSREVKTFDAAQQEAIKTAIIKSHEFTLMSVGVEGLRVSVDALTNCIENKLATKQEFAQIVMRMDALEAQLQVLQRGFHDLELEHARCKVNQRTGT